MGSTWEGVEEAGGAGRGEDGGDCPACGAADPDVIENRRAGRTYACTECGTRWVMALGHPLVVSNRPPQR